MVTFNENIEIMKSFSEWWREETNPEFRLSSNKHILYKYEIYYQIELFFGCSKPKIFFKFLKKFSNDYPSKLFYYVRILNFLIYFDINIFFFFSSCDRVDWVEERRFWTFEGLLTLLGFISGLAVFIRQKQLDHRMYQRIQKQIASGV